MQPMQPGPEFIRTYDPEGFKLIDDLYSGKADVKAMTPRREK
jgi:hypothetical protein